MSLPENNGIRIYRQMKISLSSPALVGWIFSVAVVTIFCLPLLFMDGMFMDAMLYTAVAHNLSEGIGSFWFPQFSLYNVANLPSFHEQPPLAFGIQAMFFKIFGSSMYVERLYVLFTLILSVYGIYLVWSATVKQYFPEWTKTAWIVPIFWVTMPLTFWSYSNNMHENTLTVFTLFATYFFIKSYTAQKRRLIFLALGSSATVAAFLTKGFPGLFPLAVPFWYILFFKRFNLKKIFSDYIVIFFVMALFALIFYLHQPARESLSIYLFKRALYRISAMPTTDTRWFTLYRLAMELISPILLAIVIIIFLRKKYPVQFTSEHKKVTGFFVAVGFSASLPLMATMVQKGFYMVPSFPYFAMAIAAVISDPVKNFQQNMSLSQLRVFRNISIFLLATGILATIFLAGKFKRDKVLLEDVYVITRIVPKHSVISVAPKRWNEWSLQCYLIRFGHISLEGGFNRDYYLHFKEDSLNIPPNYQPVDVSLQMFELYKKNDGN